MAAKKRSPKKWSERSESSKKRILTYYRKQGLSDRQIREGVNRGSLHPYARNPVNRASSRMRERHPELTARLTGNADRDELFRSAGRRWVNVLKRHLGVPQSMPDADVFGLNPDVARNAVQRMKDAGQDGLAALILRMEDDQLVSLAKAQSRKDLRKMLQGQLSSAELNNLGWTSPDRNGQNKWHSPFWYK